MFIEVIWEKFEDDIVIKDVTHEYYEKVKELFLVYARGSIVVRYLKIFEDADAIEELLRLMDRTLKLGMSLMLFNNNTNEVMGFCLLHAMHMQDKTWVQGRALIENKKILTMMEMGKFQAREFQRQRRKIAQSSDCLHVSFIGLKPEHKGKQWKIKLLNSAYKVAQSMFLPFLTYNPSSYNDQIRARIAGMTEEARLYYGVYRDIDGTCPFHNIIGGEFYLVFFIKPVAQPTHYEKIIIK